MPAKFHSFTCTFFSQNIVFILTVYLYLLGLHGSLRSYFTYSIFVIAAALAAALSAIYCISIDYSSILLSH
jgi:hypothetical protein